MGGFASSMRRYTPFRRANDATVDLATPDGADRLHFGSEENAYATRH